MPTANLSNYLLDEEEAEAIACDPIVGKRDRLTVAQALEKAEGFGRAMISMATLRSIEMIELSRHVARIRNKPIAIAIQTKKG